MIMQTFQAENMSVAMRNIYEKYGNDAFIYASRSHEAGIEVLAGISESIHDEIHISNDFINQWEHGAPLLNGDQIEQRFNQIDIYMQNMAVGIEELLANKKNTIQKDMVARSYESYLENLGFDQFCTQNVFKKFIQMQTSTEAMVEKVQKHIDKKVKLAKFDISNTCQVAAFVGGAGVGKTTTILKIANRFLRRHKAKQLAIITTNLKDVTINSELSSYCDLYQIEFHYAKDSMALNNKINELKNHKLVLIDTKGINQHSQREVDEMLSLFNYVSQSLSIFAVLAANLQTELMSEAVQHFSHPRVKGCILTKIDECVHLTPAIGVMMQYKKIINYFCNGQSIEEHISLPTMQRILKTMPIHYGSDQGDNLGEIERWDLLATDKLVNC